jgi:hypothetical protein
MHFSLAAIVVSTVALISHVSATITAFSAPTYTIKTGDTFNVTYTTSVSSSNNERGLNLASDLCVCVCVCNSSLASAPSEYYAIFGLTEDLYPNTIGSEPFANVDITNIPRERFYFNVPITMGPISGSGTTQTLATAVFGQVGASGGVTLQYFNTTINVAPSSSD